MAECKVSEEDLRKIFVTISNVVFHEHTGHSEWVLESDLEGDVEKEAASDGAKKRRVMQDLSSVFPSRDALREWMRAGAMLNVCMHVSTRACSFLGFLSVTSFSRLLLPPSLPPSLSLPPSPIFSSSM